MKKLYSLIAVLLAASLLLAACGTPEEATEAPVATEAPATEAPATEAPATEAPDADLLAAIQARGTIRVSTDANYAPQSVLDPNGARTEGTKCADDELTVGQMVGFDIDVAVEIATRLGVEACFVTVDWDIITAGSWADRWDISVGSMTITPPRQEILWFTSAYYYTPAQFAAATSAGFDSLDDLNGQTICVGAATTYADYLNGVLDLPETSIYAPAPTGVTVVEQPTDQDCAQSIGAGRTDFSVYLTSDTVVNQNIGAGLPVVKVGGAVYSEDLAVAIDKSHSLDPTRLVEAINAIVQEMHTDGTLTALSMLWFEGIDLTLDPNP